MLERRAAGAAGRHRGNQNPLFPLCIHLTNLTYVWSLPVEHRPQITCLSLSSSVTFCRLRIFLSRSLFQVFLGCRLLLRSCGVHCSACMAKLSSYLLITCPNQFHFLLLRCSNTGSSPVFILSSLLDILLGKGILCAPLSFNGGAARQKA